jgi:Bacterial membrane protein YfhO
VGMTRSAGTLLRRRGVAPGAAALLVLVVYAVEIAALGIEPFGHTSRAFNDLANQYVPFHDTFWDLAHGRAQGDLLFSWQAGFGTGFLANFATYLTNPFSLLALAVPRADVPMAVYAVTPLSMAAAAAAMTGYLRMLTPERARTAEDEGTGAGAGRDYATWARVVLGASYGLCGWAFNASYIPMWQWGLVALPLLGFAAEWCLRRHRWTAAALVVALAWYGNFFTAVMATIAIAVIFAVRLALLDATPRRRLAATVRAATAVGVGVALNAPLILVSFKASKAAAQTNAPPLSHAPIDVFLAQFLPATSFATDVPLVFTGLLALVLALTFPANPGIARRTRVLWSCAVVLVALSFQWGPTQYIWHGMERPNGGHYRETWVLSALLVIVAWQSCAARVRARTVAIAAALVLLLAVAVSGLSGITGKTWVGIAVGGPLAVGGFLLWQGRRDGSLWRWAAPAGITMTVVAVAAGAAYSGAVNDHNRSQASWAAPKPVWNAQIAAKSAAIRAGDTWPASRTDPGPPQYVDNETSLVGGQGPEYYSSYVPAVTSRTLSELGFSTATTGRNISADDNPVIDALFSIGAHVVPSGSGYTVEQTGPFAPFVTIRQAPTGTVAPLGSLDTSSVWAAQEQLLGASVYQVPGLTVTGDATAVPGGSDAVGGPWKVDGTAQATARCTAGESVYAYAPMLSVRITQSVVPADRRVTVTFVGKGTLPARAIGCLDQAKLTTAVTALRSSGASSFDPSGHGFTATVPPGSTGFAVAATTDVAGWSCSVNGAAATLVSFHGLLGITLSGSGGAGSGGAQQISCGYLPPGLKAGLALGVLAGVVLVLVTAWFWYRRRRDQRRSNSAVTIEAVSAPQSTMR